MTAVEVEPTVADAVANSLIALAGFVLCNPEFAEAVAGESFYLTVPTGEWAARAAQLFGSDDTTEASDYMLATRSFGVLDVAVQAPKAGAS